LDMYGHPGFAVAGIEVRERYMCAGRVLVNRPKKLVEQKERDKQQFSRNQRLRAGRVRSTIYFILE
jgi:hypothetical protein